jgi:hypothetical protein
VADTVVESSVSPDFAEDNEELSARNMSLGVGENTGWDVNYFLRRRTCLSVCENAFLTRVLPRAKRTEKNFEVQGKK